VIEDIILGGFLKKRNKYLRFTERIRIFKYYFPSSVPGCTPLPQPLTFDRERHMTTRDEDQLSAKK